MPSNLSNSVLECTESAYKRKTKTLSSHRSTKRKLLVFKKQLIGTHLHMVYLFEYSVGITYTLKSITKNWNRQAVSHFHYIHHLHTIYKIQVEHKTFIKKMSHMVPIWCKILRKSLNGQKKSQWFSQFFTSDPLVWIPAKTREWIHKKEVQF